MFIIKNPPAIRKEEIDNAFRHPSLDDFFPQARLHTLTTRTPKPARLLHFSALGRGLERAGREFRALTKRPDEEILFADLGREVRKGVGEEVPIEAFALDDAAVEEMAEATLPEESFEKEIEEIIAEKWRYLVMQFGGIFLTEIRPEKCFIGDKRLADSLIRFEKGVYSLDLNLLERYLSKSSRSPVQIHFSDIIFNPRTQDYDVFSVTSGDIKKAAIFLDLAKFLSSWNKGRETIIPVHLPYFEKWKGQQEKIFGELSEDGKRDAVIRAEAVLRYLTEKWPAPEIKLALETGSGESSRKGEVKYALIYEPHHLKFLTQGRENLVGLCEDVGHLNLTSDSDWRDYLCERIFEFHVSGNNGREDQHTVATPSTLKSFRALVSYLRFFNGNVCAEIGRGDLSLEEFVGGVKALAYELFSTPTPEDFRRLLEIERYLKATRSEELCRENLSPERYKKFARDAS